MRLAIIANDYFDIFWFRVSNNNDSKPRYSSKQPTNFWDILWFSLRQASYA